MTDDAIDIYLVLNSLRKAYSVCHAPIMEGKRAFTWIISHWFEIEISHHTNSAFSHALDILDSRLKQSNISSELKSLAAEVHSLFSDILSSGPLLGFPIQLYCRLYWKRLACE